jgi:hypothetical protein
MATTMSRAPPGTNPPSRNRPASSRARAASPDDMAASSLSSARRLAPAKGIDLAAASAAITASASVASKFSGGRLHRSSSA